MLTATEFLIKTLKEIMGLPLADEYYKRKYSISKNIFSIYSNINKKVAHFGKSAAEALTIILVNEILENQDKEMLLMNFMDKFLSENEKDYIGVEPEVVIPYVISKFTEHSSTFEIFSLLDKGHYSKCNQLRQVFSSRSAMYDNISFLNLISKSKKIDAIGISINELTIKFNRRSFIKLVKSGININLLFLDPHSENTVLREKEELLPENQIKNMTLINLNYMEKLMNELDHPSNLKVYIYDAIPRLNMIFIDNKYLILQNYAQYTRGEDCPCYYIQNDDNDGIYQFYYGIYEQFITRTKVFKGYSKS
ncbi:MAG: DUF5919 domain-containing protein [Clostridiales bacterium]